MCSPCHEHAISTPEARAVHVRNMQFPRQKHAQCMSVTCSTARQQCMLVVARSTCNPMQVARAVSSQYHVLFLAITMDISMPLALARGISRQQKNCTSTTKAHAIRRRYCAQLDAPNHNTTDTDTGTCVNHTGNYRYNT
jgi:hypothetical protein